jgi:hypothetical protein
LPKAKKTYYAVRKNNFNFWKTRSFTLVTQLRSGFIVEDISTGKKASISNSSQVSLLDNIAIYTFDKEVPLFEVFKNVAEKYNTNKPLLINLLKMN